MGTNPTFTDEQVLKPLRKHMVDNLHSKYSFHKPMTWQGVLKRMERDAEFAVKVNTIENEALEAWETLGITALRSNDENFNVNLFKMYAGSKKSFQSYETLELEERIIKLEDRHE